MDPRRSKQDVLRCDLCETPVPPLHCDICHVNLCKPCVGEHVSNESKEHRVVPFKKRGSTPKCLKHSSKICELHCEQCHSPICALCVSSFDHEQHLKVDIFKKFEQQKEALRRDLQELENRICPKYQEILSEIPIQRKDLKSNSKKLKAAINKQGELLHTAINSAINKMKDDVDDMNHKCLVQLQKREDNIATTISEIKQNMSNMKKLLESYDVCHVCAYNSKNTIFQRWPPKLTVYLPKFISHQIDGAQINQQLGLLLKLRVRTEENGYNFTSTDVVFPLTNQQLINAPRIISSITTEFSSNDALRQIACVGDREIWTSGSDGLMKLYDLRGELLKSVKTRSGYVPFGIAVIRFGDFIYADLYDRSLNIVMETGVYTMVRFQGWIPCGLCGTSSDDLLLVLVNDSNNQTKVVRYFCSTEKQTIQFDQNGQPLYSTIGRSDIPKCICENNNLDICVADTNAVVVVSQSGEFRFRYHPRGAFLPIGIATDSQSRILISSQNTDSIHILDQDGFFLRYIENCFLMFPCGLCVDINDNLFVAESTTGKVKTIQYCSK